jgi:hypothetical protein
MAELLDELQDAEIDAATREELIADLRAADPAQWPLIVGQVKATLAYRRQMRQLDESASPIDSPPDAAQEASVTAVADATAAEVSVEPTRFAPQTDPARVPEANDIGTGFLADADASHVGGSEPEPTVAAVAMSRTPLPEPEPAEVALAPTAPSQVAEGGSAPPAIPAESRVVTAAFEEPIYQTADTTALSSAADSASRPSHSDLPWQELLDLAIAGLEEETSTAPATSGEIGRHARLRLLQLAAENNAAAVAPIEGVPPNQQDFWSKQLFGLSAYLDDVTQPDVRQRAAVAQRHLQEATDQLGEVAVLEVRNLAFCSSIRGFGVYESLDRPRFRAGEQVKLYAEVENYRSEPTPDGYRTHLATSYEVLDEDDRRVDSGEFPQVEDVCRARRRDFHIQYGVHLPTRIYPGKYRLQITIEDALSRKLGRASVEFEIVDDRTQTQ